jgi:hypothetical protein
MRRRFFRSVLIGLFVPSADYQTMVTQETLAATGDKLEEQKAA